MDTIILCTIFGVFILISFLLGLVFGFKLRNDEKITMPNLNPIKTVKNYKKEKEFQKNKELEEEILKINLENIENYNGTEYGQKEFPE